MGPGRERRPGKNKEKGRESVIDTKDEGRTSLQFNAGVISSFRCWAGKKVSGNGSVPKLVLRGTPAGTVGESLDDASTIQGK